MAWDLFWRSQNTVQTQCVYYIELTREAGLLHTSEQGGGDYNIQINREKGLMVYSWTKETGLSTLNRSSLQGISMQGKKFTAEHSTYTVNTWIWFPRVGFAILLCLKLWGP